MTDPLAENLWRELRRLELFAIQLGDELEDTEAAIAEVRSEIAVLMAKNTDSQSTHGGDSHD